MANLKFWFIGSLSYPHRSRSRSKPTATGAETEDKSGIYLFRKIREDEYEVAKPSRKCYERKLFDRYLGSLEEAQDRLNQLSRWCQGEKPVITAESLFRKYTAVKNACIRMLTSTREFYFVHEHKNIIDYIATHEDATLTFRSEYDDIPTLPEEYQDQDLAFDKYGFYGDFYH